MAHGGETMRRASVFEIVGAWLHLWVPPRDVDIPPVPWRKLALWGGAAVVVLGAALAIMIPRIDAGNARRTAAYRAQVAKAHREYKTRVTAEQAPHHGSAAAFKPAAGASAAERASARVQLVGQVQASVFADAKARAAQGLIRPVEGPTTCDTERGTTTTGVFGVLDCFVVTTQIKKTSRTVAGALGYPFRAVVDYRRFTYNWCKLEGIPGEMMIPDPRYLVKLPKACQAPDL